MNELYQIAIDGPSGAGKSTIAKLLSERLGILYLDTGAMYRAIGLYMYRRGIDFENECAVAEALEAVQLEVFYQNGEQKISLNGEDVSQKIREHRVSALASDISRLGAVRKKLVEMQRRIAAEQCCVLDGRDIGTYVLPDAKFKFYLTASAQCRAHRRTQELLQKKMPADYETVLADIEKRDYNDIHRAIAPLRRADDAVEIDSTESTVEQVVQKMLCVIRRDGDVL